MRFCVWSYYKLTLVHTSLYPPSLRCEIVGIQKVVRKVLRTCIHGSHRQLNTPGEDRLCVDGSSKANAVVLLTRLLLRGNSITDAGALALVPLVKESPHLTELDLRDNAIGANGKLALKKVTNLSDSNSRPRVSPIHVRAMLKAEPRAYVFAVHSIPKITDMKRWNV